MMWIKGAHGHDVGVMRRELRLRWMREAPQHGEHDGGGDDECLAFRAKEPPGEFFDPAGLGFGGGNAPPDFATEIWRCLGLRHLPLGEQIIERIGPMRQKQSGYDRPCLVYPILARGTVDEMVLERLRTKATVQELLLKAMEKRK